MLANKIMCNSLNSQCNRKLHEKSYIISNERINVELGGESYVGTSSEYIIPYM
jgi:hypothetical protein